jgi:glycosyl transferase, family 25
LLPIFYINLASRTDRREFMEEQLAALGLSAVRVEAVTPDDLSAEEITSYCDSSRLRHLRPRELACTRSHERAWEMMIAAGQGRALILEDDAELSPLLPAFLGEIAKIDVDLVRIEGASRPLRVFPPMATTSSGVQLRPFRSTPMGSSGYVIKASAARQLLGHPGLRRKQTDLALYDPFEAPGALLSRVQTVPGLCKQLSRRHPAMLAVARSDIVTDAASSVPKPFRQRLYGVGYSLFQGLRNAADHLVHSRKGLVRMRIPFSGNL